MKKNIKIKIIIFAFLIHITTMKKIFFPIVLCLLLTAQFITQPLFSQIRGKIDIPDLKGYVTLKCDFHMHTVFSDGTVWPTVRIDEAYREGLDAISITEHLEGRRYLQEIERLTDFSFKNLSHHISYDIAQPYAKEKGIMLIRGSEISRSMPPGHFNAIFLANSDELNKPDYMDAFRAAKAQKAFIFWNHPGWLSQQPDVTLWWPEHTQLLEQGMMHGIEVAGNSAYQYYPEAHRWCLEKKLTMIGNSDAHPPIETHMELASVQHRTMTFVFARNASVEAIYEALNERRTAVYWKEFIIGEEKYLKELFENALEWKVEKTKNVVNVTVKNKSDLIFHLKPTNHDPRIVYFRNLTVEPFTIAPQSVKTFTVRLLEGKQNGDVNFCVENFLVQPNTGMNYTLKIE